MTAPAPLHRLAALIAVAAVVSCAHGARRAVPDAPPSEPELDDAIATMKGVEPSRFTKEQAHAKDAALDQAWKTLKAHRARAVARLESELRALRARGGKDDFFSIDAACLLWEMAGVDAAASIAAALDGVDLGAHFEVVLPTFSSAAMTKDERVLPILRHALATDQKTGTFFFVEHFLQIGWPTTLDFMLAPFGPTLCERFPLPAEPPADARVGSSLLYLADKLACPDAPPSLRRWARDGRGDLEKEAAIVLSHLGAPEDRAWFESLAASEDPKTRKLAAYALYEYGDPATAPTLRRLLADPDADVRLEAISGVFHLIDTEGVRALLARRRVPDLSKDEHERIESMIGGLAKDAGVDAGPLAAGNAAAWEVAIRAYWTRRDALFELRAGDRTLDRTELTRALDHWEKEGRLASSEGDWTAWIESRHVLSVAVPTDARRLVAVRGSILRRQSDEALDEVQTVDRMIGILRRRAAGAVKPNE